MRISSLVQPHIEVGGTVVERCGHVKMDLEKISCVPKKMSHDFAHNNKQCSISTSAATTTTNSTHHSQHSQQHQCTSTMTGAQDAYASQALGMFSLIFTFFYNSTNTFTDRQNMTTGTTNGHHYHCHSTTQGHSRPQQPPPSPSNGPRDVSWAAGKFFHLHNH